MTMHRDVHYHGDGTAFHWVTVVFADGTVVSFSADPECSDESCVAYAKTHRA
jgi:hypothetical protein